MLPKTHYFLIALTAALLIVFGTFGIFTAEASSFSTIMSETQRYGTIIPMDANQPGLTEVDAVSIPGLPY
jgi:hypothetical protein